MGLMKPILGITFCGMTRGMGGGDERYATALLYQFNRIGFGGWVYWYAGEVWLLIMVVRNDGEDSD